MGRLWLQVVHKKIGLIIEKPFARVIGLISRIEDATVNMRKKTVDWKGKHAIIYRYQKTKKRDTTAHKDQVFQYNLCWCRMHIWPLLHREGFESFSFSQKMSCMHQFTLYPEHGNVSGKVSFYLYPRSVLWIYVVCRSDFPWYTLLIKLKDWWSSFLLLLSSISNLPVPTKRFTRKLQMYGCVCKCLIIFIFREIHCESDMCKRLDVCEGHSWSRWEEFSGPVSSWRRRGRGGALTSEAPSSRITEAIFRMSLIFPHRSRPF